MQKKLIAVAVAGALGAPVLAHAQASTVQVFGTVYTEYAWINQGRGPAGDRVNVDMLQTPGTEIGFKGEEQLGGGLSAWFQCATTMDIRGQDQNGLCSRNSGVGFKGAFGNVWVGNWDTPMKRVSLANRITNDTGAFGTGFLLMGGSTTVNGAASPGLFSRRQNNSINYESPNFNGFSVMVSTTATTTQTNALSSSPVSKPRLWSAGVMYANGPLNVGAAYEQHKDFVPGVANYSGTDDMWLLTAGYQFGPVKLGGIYNRRKFETGPGTDLDVNAWHVAADWNIAGPHGLRGSYTKTSDTKGNYSVAQAAGGAGSGIAGSSNTLTANGGAGGTSAHLWQIHYVNTLSKRTEVTFGYARLDNAANASAATGGVSAPARGEDQHSVGMSVRHRF